MNQNICNICGANYEYRNGRWFCPACGAYKQEELSNEEVTLLYNAAQKLRMSDFDEAEKEYADIIEKFPKNANGYWGRLLSKYGIKYEEDFDGRKIPTCYATSIESVISDKDYKKAIELADEETTTYYKRQAEYIERVRKEWVEKAKKEKPYDIFLCYKDSDIPNGIDRTQDSIAVQDLYIHLTEQGYRVFFSRESLRGKVGEKYEPYIFNALSTAKVMLVYGSKSEYITSTWLKNEWTRYEKRIQSGEKKANSLLVACDGFPPNELPKTLASRQCFDATKRSFYSDLDALVKKIIKGEEKPKVEPKEQPQKKEKSKKNNKILFAFVAVALALVVGLCVLIPNLIDKKSPQGESVSSVTNTQFNSSIVLTDDDVPKGTTFEIEEVNAGVQQRYAINKLNINKENYHLFDLTLKYNNEIVTIDGNALVTMPIPTDIDQSKAVVYYLWGDLSEKMSSTVTDGKISFTTNHFSYYLIAEAITTIAPSKGYTTVEEGYLTVGVSADCPPYEYIEDGDYKGIEVDILKAIATELGLAIRFENDAFDELLGNLTAKEVDCIIGLTETAQRNEIATTTNVLFVEDDFESVIYLNKDNDELRTSINSAINKLKNNNTIASIIESYATTETTTSVTIIFNANGGYGIMPNQKIDVNSSDLLNKCAYIRDGYNFLGWATSASGTVVYIDENDFSVQEQESITLYAVWEKIVIQVSVGVEFDANGGTGTKQSLTIPQNSTFIFPECGYVKEGYSFVAWVNSPTNITQIRYPGEEGSVGTMGLTKYYAMWAANENTVIFNANGGSGTMSSQKMKTDEKKALNNCTFTRDGYSFIGWATTSDGEVVYSNQAQYTMGTENEYTLYAVWDINKVALIYDANGGEGSMESQLLLPNQVLSLNENEYRRSGYGFKGWSLTPNGEIAYRNMSNFTMGTTSITLYAVWEATDTAIVLNPNGGKGVALTTMSKTDETITLPLNTFTRDGYDFVGWATISYGEVKYLDGAEYVAGPNVSYNLYAIWSPTTYTISYNLDGGSVNGLKDTYTIETSAFTLPNPQKEGYEFVGWSGTNISGTQKVVTIQQGSMGNRSYTANWKENTYTVTYYANDGTNTNKSNSGIKNGSVITLPECTFTLSGYSFVRWQRFLGNSSEYYYPGDEYTISDENVVFHAEWKKIYNYTSQVTSITITSYIGNEETINVPQYIDGLPVKAIWDSCFRGCSARIINIPEGIESIGHQAFAECSNLESVSIPKSVTYIRGEALFAPGTNKINSIIISSENATYESIGNCIIEKASKKLIAGCSNSTIPNGVITIGTAAFCSANGLTSLEIPEGVLKIEQYAFESCINLNNIVLPSSLVNVEYLAFYDCPKLVHITNLSGISFSELPNNPNMEIRTSSTQEFKNIISTEGDFIKYTVGNTKYILQYIGNDDTVDLTQTDFTSIYQYAFHSNETVKKLIISDKITEIGMCAFEYAQALDTVVIGNNVRTIGERAFSSCINLSDLTIGNSVSVIAKMAFYRCSKLKEIVIPNAVRYIGQSAFNESGLQTAIFEDVDNWYAPNNINVSNSSTNAIYLTNVLTYEVWEKIPTIE